VVEGVLPITFNTSYGDGTEINGLYANESVSIAGADLQSVIIGVALEQIGGPSPDFTPLMGIGFNELESSNGLERGDSALTYPNIISQLVLQNKIRTRAYSIWFSDRSKCCFLSMQSSINVSMI
jgi:hypothetical protein